MHVAADEGSGPAVVLLHGQPGDAEELLLLRQALRGRGLRVVTVDRPGYYPGSTATGYAGNAAALAGLLDHLGLASATVVGISWAGAVALAFGLAHPERTEGLLLVSSVGAPGSVTFSDVVLALPGAGQLSAWALPRLAGLLEWTSGSRFTPAARAITRKASARWRGSGAWRAFKAEQQAMLADTAPLWERLGPFPFPVTVVQGRRDAYVPVRAGRLLAGRLQADYREVDAGHVLHLEVPVLLAAELIELVGRAGLTGLTGPTVASSAVGQVPPGASAGE